MKINIFLITLIAIITFNCSDQISRNLDSANQVFDPKNVNDNLKLNINPSFIYNDYCFDDGNDQMQVSFKVKNDTVFLYYIDVLDHGNYINGYADSADYAGGFLLKEIQDHKVNVKIKNYRFPETYCLLNLIFNIEENSLEWKVESMGPIAYLPKIIILKKCKS